MPLAFLVPAFLAGLAALAIPVLVHLRHRERKEPVRFPSLMFLRRIPFREVRRQQIHHWPLFVMRLLALVLLAFAFARPFLRGAAALVSPASGTGREVVVLLDRSASMGYGTAWPRARDSVRAVFTGLDRGDRATLMVFDQAPVALNRPTADRSLLDAALDQARPGTGVTRYAPALRAARDLLVGTELPGRELVLITDFQRAGWRGEVIEPLPEGTVFRTVDLSSDAAENLGLTGVELVHDGDGTRSRVTVTARVATAGLESPRQVRAALLLDGRQVAEREVTIEGPTASVTFAPVPVADGRSRGLVRLTAGDSLPADDEIRFLAERERPLRVLVVEGGPGRFLRRALAISRSPRVEVMVRDVLRAGDLANVDAVVLDDAPAPAGDAARRLGEFVQQGGGLLVVLGNAPATLPEWTGVRATTLQDRAGSPGAVGAARREHPIFEPFRGSRSGDFGATRVFRYRRIEGDSLEVLARYDDGAAALAEVALGRGRVVIWTSALDNIWSDLPLQPTFLPLAHQLVQYAARHVQREPAHVVGQVAAIGLDALGRTEAVVVVSPSGERTRRALADEPLSVAIEEAGFYEVREAGAGGRLLAVLAANVDPDETGLASFDPADLGVAAGAVASDSARATPGERALLTAQEREREQSLWWFALAGLALLLAAETFFGNRLTGYVRAQPAAGEGT